MRTVLWMMVLLCGLLPLGSWAADADDFKEGVHYQVVSNPEGFLAPNKIEVLEFFWYGCPHCYQFESDIEPWLARKPEEIRFKRIPHSLGRSTGEMHATAYHIAENLDIVKRIHAQMFKAIHDRKQNMDTLADICALFVQFGGVTEDQCRASAENFDVKHASDHDEFLIQRYAVINVPTLVVDGRYTTNAVMAGGMGKLIKVLNFLIAKQKVARHVNMTLPDEDTPQAPQAKAPTRPPPLF